MVWAYLGSLKGAKKKKQDPLAGRPDEIADFELVPTVDRGMISLRQIFEDASQHRRRVLVTELAAARQLSERPILVCGEDKRKILRRVLGVHMQDYTRELQMELAVLDRMGQRQPAVLRVGTVMKVSFDEDGMTGELGIPTQWEGKQTKGPEHWVRVMREGVALERVPLTVDRIPFVAVIDCPRFRPTSRWDSVVRDEVWKDALAVLRRVAGALVMRACSDIAGAREPNLVDPAILRALREMAGERFRGRPRLASEGDPEMEQRLADAPIWQSAAAEGGTLTLRQIGNARSDTGSVWLVGEEVGHVAPGRVIVQARDDATTAALSSIFSGTVKDGREVLRRDEEAYQRRQQAPVMQTSLDATQALASQWIESADEELGVEVRGQVALSRNYREAPRGKLNLRLAVDGRFLCESTVPHALRGLGNLDCRGLAPNRDWNGVADGKQLGFVNRVAARALWDSVEEFVRDGIAAPPGTTAREHEQAMLEEALRWLVVKPDKRPELLAQLMAAPLFTSVRGQRMSARELVAIAEDAGELLAVSAELRGGDPVDGRLVIRASEMGLRVLEDLTGAALRRHDEEWKAELRGQRRRRELPEVEPTLGEPLVEQIYFQEGDTYGVVGMQPPRTDGRYQDRDDPASLLRIHVGRRMVTERQVVWHPAVLVWINDNRFRTTPGFDDVLADDTFTAALHLVAAQIPELVARAAESCLHAPEDSLRLRICNYVLTRLDSLWEKADAEPASAAGKLLDAQLWRCLTGAGDRTLSTRQLRAANEVGRLRTVPESASGRPAASDVVVLRASEQELAWLGEAFGVLEDYSGQLERDETLRAFLARPPVEAVALSAASEAGELLHRRSLSGSGWEGEIGLRDDTGRTLSVSIYWQRRWLVTRELASPVSAAAAVQADSLLVNGAYDEVVEDPAYKAFVNRLFGELWAALDEMASGLDGAPVAGGGRIRHACVRALAGIRAKDHPLAAPPEVERSLRRAPLFVDVRGRAWSSDELEEAAGRGARVAAIAPDTATLGEPLGDQPVLVVAAGAWQDTAAVLPLERFDSAFVESIEGRKRRESAETSFRLSRRRTLVRAEVTGPEFGGEIGLGLPPADGWLALFARGRKVEKRAFPDCPGLVGSLDGAIETDHGFQHARLSGEQERAIHQLYEQRLEAAVSAAAEYSGSKRSREWKALCEYVLRYLESALAGLEGGIEERRKRLARRDQSLPPVLLAAAELPVFRLDRGGWVALTSVIGGDVADVVITSERVKHPTDTDAELLVGDPAGLRPLLCSVLGARAVHEYHAWLEGLEARAAKRAEAQRKRQETRRRRLLASVKSMLRDALDRHPADDLKRADIQRLKLEHRLGGGELTVPGGKKGKQVRLSSDHAVWQAALDAAGTNEVADQHLAAAVLADLACAAEPRLTAEELYALLACVARRGREGEQRLVATLEQIATRRTR